MSDAPFEVRACLEKVRQGHEGSARELVEHLYPLVIKIIRSHRHRRVAEEDQAQEIFMKMFHRLHQYEGQLPFEHWVSRIAVNTCRDTLRHHMRRPEWRWADFTAEESEALSGALEREQGPDPSESAAAREAMDKLLECLSPDDRLVITLLDVEDWSLEEVHEKTGWNKTLIKVRAFRARRKLRKHLESLQKEKERHS